MRYAEQLPLPSYQHVPGQTPHPMRDPQGHALMGVNFAAKPLDPDRWPESAAYCYAIDLFNNGYYWEAHEVWEGLWRGAGRVGTVADFLKGLIKLAAALVKAREGRCEGVRRHAHRADQLFAAVYETCHSRRPVARVGGLSLEDLRTLADRIARDAPSISLKPPADAQDACPPWLGTYRLTPSR